MANPLPIKKSLAALLSFFVLFSTVGPSGLAFKIPTANAATFTVNNLNDSGAGSLRQAIMDANANVGHDTVTFDIAGTVTLLSDLPSITESLILDATTTTQLGPNIVLSAVGLDAGLTFNSGSSNAVYGIAITGAQNCFSINSGVTGLTIGNSSSEGGVEVNNCSNRGLDINGASNVNIVHTLIGTDGANETGIYIGSNASDITIGGTTTAERNIISGNAQHGIYIAGVNNLRIRNSYIGVDKNGVTQANGEDGIYIDSTGATNVVIGGTTTEESNVISGNNAYGVKTYSNGVTIKGNYIGVDPTGMMARPNEQGGILLESSDNLIGGNTSSDGNIISGNDTHGGIRIDGNMRTASDNIILNNIIGQSADGSSTIANVGDGIQISGSLCTGTVIGSEGMGNTISGNTQNGINIQNDASDTTIEGNVIGLSESGDEARGNGEDGIFLSGNNTTIGLANTSGSINYIGGNGETGIQISSSNNTIKNNCLGTTLACEENENLRNDLTAIQLVNGASNNIIGGDSEGEANTIHAKTGQMAILVADNAGDNNTFNHNDFLDLGVGENFTSVTAPANESIEAPTINSVIRHTPTSATLVGITETNYRLDVFAGGIWLGNYTAETDGSFDITVDSEATNFTMMATNESGSTSGTSNIQSATNDTSAPNPPTAEANQDTANPGATVAISGTGESGTNVYSNNEDTGIDVDESGNYSFNVTILGGENTFQVTLVDGMNNISTATTVTINGSQNNAGGAASIAGITSSQPETGNVVDPDTQTTIDTGTTTDETTSIAGDEEVVEPENTTTDETNTSTEENTSEENTSEDSSSNEDNSAPQEEEKPVKSFVEVIYEVVEPIKIKTIRDTLPQEAAIEPKFNETLANVESFGEANNDYGIPDTLLEVKLGEKGLSTTNLNQDADGDGLTNGEEVLYFSDPLNTDSDGDGVDDVHEVFETGTDPSSYDSDRDGLADTLDEAPLVYSNPETRVSSQEIADYIQEEQLTTTIGMTDSDEDGLADLLELYLDTDPQEKDSDKDGLTDGDEVQQYGTDPKARTSDSQLETLYIANVTNGEVVVEGQQFYMGQAPANTHVSVYSVETKDALTLLGETDSDEKGRFNLLTEEELKPGKQTIVAVAGDLDAPIDISAPFSTNVLSYVKKPDYVSLNLKNGSSINDLQPTLDLRAAEDSIIVVSWRSTIYSQTLIADSADQTVYAKPAENLELGDHTVTWYAVDPESNQKSDPTRVAFTVTNAAFINGENESNMWTILLSSVAVLASLSALGLYFRKNKTSK